MRQRYPVRLGEGFRRLWRIVANWRRRDPRPWVVALVAVALGLGVFLLMLAWVGTLYLMGHVTRWHR